MSRLLIIPTPVGNLKDITLRAIEVLKESDYILCEDTRQTKKLTAFYDIETPLKPYHKDNEHLILDKTIDLIKSNQNISLVSDSGTPAISDPGFLLIRECIKQGITVECLPGATAFVPALVCSGLPINSFIFEGFLPHKKGRSKTLEILKNETRTILLYESPHRLMRTLIDLKTYFGETLRISVSRELTKLYEETIQGTIDQLIKHFSDNKPKGEFVLVLKKTNSK